MILETQPKLVWYFYDFSTLYFQLLKTNELSKQNNITRHGLAGQAQPVDVRVAQRGAAAQQRGASGPQGRAA